MIRWSAFVAETVLPIWGIASETVAIAETAELFASMRIISCSVLMMILLVSICLLISLLVAKIMIWPLQKSLSSTPMETFLKSCDSKSYSFWWNEIHLCKGKHPWLLSGTGKSTLTGEKKMYINLCETSDANYFLFCFNDDSDGE